jgi:hypothetical protein
MSNSTRSPVSQHFEDEFSKKNLVGYEECGAHYEHMTPDQLVEELGFLLDPRTTAIPFGFSGQRYYAFWHAFAVTVANYRLLTCLERSRLVNTLIDFKDYILARTADDSREKLQTALAGIRGIWRHFLFIRYRCDSGV